MSLYIYYYGLNVVLISSFFVCLFLTIAVLNNGLTGSYISKDVTTGYNELVWFHFITPLGMRKIFESMEVTIEQSTCR